MSVHPPVPVQLSVHNGVQFVLHLGSGMLYGITFSVLSVAYERRAVLKRWMLKAASIVNV